MRKMAPVGLAVQGPETEAGKAELARRVAEVHAGAVIRRIRELNCPAERKRRLLDAVITESRERM